MEVWLIEFSLLTVNQNVCNQIIIQKVNDWKIHLGEWKHLSRLNASRLCFHLAAEQLSDSFSYVSTELPETIVWSVLLTSGLSGDEQACTLSLTLQEKTSFFFSSDHFSFKLQSSVWSHECLLSQQFVPECLFNF